MRQLFKLLATVSLFVVFMIPPASFASVRISLVGTGTFAKPKVDSGDAYSSKTGFGGGALLGVPLGMRTEFETGALYVTRKFDDTTQNNTIKVNGIEVPVLLRFHLHPIFSIGVGGYGAFGMGNINGTGDVNGTTTSYTYSAAGYKKTDYGALASVQFRLPIKPGMRFLVDGRYAYGLSNVNAGSGSLVTGSSLKFRDMQVLAGIQFGMGGGR